MRTLVISLFIFFSLFVQADIRTYAKTVRPDQLASEISSSGLPTPLEVRMDSLPDSVVTSIAFSDDLSEAQGASLDTVVANHVPKAPTATLADKQAKLIGYFNDPNRTQKVRTSIFMVMIGGIAEDKLDQIITLVETP